MPNLFLDRDLNRFVAENTMSEKEFLAAQKKLEEENGFRKQEKDEGKENDKK